MFHSFMSVNARSIAPLSVLPLLLVFASAWAWESAVIDDAGNSRFQITRVDNTAPDDVDLPVARRDVLVRIFRGQTSGSAGLTGPQFGNFDQSHGHYPCYEGNLALIQDASSRDSDPELTSTLCYTPAPLQLNVTN
jgi:hypothetical protein